MGVTSSNAEEGGNSKRTASVAQNLIKDQTESILNALIAKEAVLSGGKDTKKGASTEVKHLTALVNQLLDGYNKLDDNHLFVMPWLCPKLSACIQSNDKDLRSIVHILVQRMFNGPLSDKMKSAKSGTPTLQAT